MDSGDVQFVSSTVRVTRPCHIVVNLKAEVEAAVKSHASSIVAPPFSVAEIMVMAWVCRKDQYRHNISDEEISDWLVLTFGYYRKLALRELHAHGFQMCITTYKDRNSFHNFTYQRLLESERLELPLRASLPPQPAPPTKRTYNSTLPSSRRFLRRALGNEMSAFDRLFDLPAEIRLMIYEEVLRMPAEEIQYDDREFDLRNKNTQLRLSSRGKRSERSYYTNWTACLVTGYAQNLSDYTPEPWATEPTSNLMALLLVSRQIFEEAMPVFYNVNTFHAKNLHDLTRMLQHCGERRRACFTSISFDYGDRAGPRVTKKAFTLLKEVKHLHSLQVSIKDSSYFAGQPGAAAYKSADGIPGIELLSTVRVRELEFPCTCPRIESFLRPKMLTNTEAENVKGKEKSRKVPRRNTKATRDT